MDRVSSLGNVNIKSNPVSSTVSSSGAGPPTVFEGGSRSTVQFYLGNVVDRFSTMPRWVGITALASTTAIAAAGCYYFFYARGSTSVPESKLPKSNTGKTDKTLSPETTDLKTLGNEYFKKNDLKKALECYTKAIQSGNQTNEQLSVLYQNRAAVFEKLGDKLEVVNECTLALKFQPCYVKALMRRAKALKDTGFLMEALEDVTTICMNQQFQNASALHMADDLLKELGHNEAKKLVKSRKPSEPSKHSIISYLRSFHEDPISVAWGDGGDSVSRTVNGQSCHEGSEQEEDANKSGYFLALAQLHCNQFSELIKLCDEEINIKESKFKNEAYLMRGTFKFLWGYQAEVLEDLNNIVEDPEASPLLKASAWVKIALFLRHAEWDTGEQSWIRAFEEAQKCTPDNTDVYHHWGQQLMLKGDFEGALIKMKKACECSEFFPVPAATKVFLEYRQGFCEEDHQKIGNALVEFNQLETKYPNCPDVFNYYGQILMETQQLDKAYDIFDYILKIDPLNTNVVVHKALCQSQKVGGMDANMSGYLKQLRDSLKVDDKNALVWETIGTLEVHMGNEPGALEALNKSLELAKTFPEIAALASMKLGTQMQFDVKKKLNLL